MTEIELGTSYRIKRWKRLTVMCAFIRGAVCTHAGGLLWWKHYWELHEMKPQRINFFYTRTHELTGPGDSESPKGRSDAPKFVSNMIVI